MPAASRVQLRLADPEWTRAIAEQIEDAPDLMVAGGDADSMPPDLVLTDADRLDAAGAHSGMVLGLGHPSAGAAANCVAMPVHIEELLARIRAALRHLREERPRFRIGSAVFDAEAGVIRDTKGGVHSLTRLECETLAYLCRAGGRAVSGAELRGAVWGYAEDAETHTVETHIWRLRETLRQAGACGTLRTEAGGYRCEAADDR